jgi:hypothetical protein
MTKAAFRLSCVALLQACSYTSESIGDQSDIDAIVTVREPEREFDEMRTFAMPESVADLSNLAEDPRPITDAYDQDFIDRVAVNFAEYGWTRVADVAAADVLILNGKVASENWVTFSYWYPYYPYYIYYPYYPYDSVTVNYETGTIMTLMIESDQLETIDDIETVPAIWVATGLGLLESDESPRTRIEDAVDQAFEQSDYLVVGDPVDPILGLDAPLPQ